LGFVLLAAGFGVDVWVLWGWIEAGFGALERVRPALVATALMAVGVQLFFFSFCVAIISPPARQPKAVPGSHAVPAIEKRRLRSDDSQADTL
jgi:hypothetical protein